MAKEEERGKGERGRDGEKGKVERGKINVEIVHCVSLFLDYRVTTLSLLPPVNPPLVLTGLYWTLILVMLLGYTKLWTIGHIIL